MSSWVILGCGYTGEHLAARLLGRVPDSPTCGATGADQVIGVVRNEGRAAELARLGLASRVADPRVPGAMDGWLPQGFILVDSIPTERGAAPHARAVVRAAARAHCRRVVYLSSTAVYPRGDGSWIEENTPTSPDTPRGHARLAMEREYFEAAAEHGLSAAALRIAAIYGPGRGIVPRIRAGGYRVVGDGSNYFSRIHVEDLVSAIVAASTATCLVRHVYLVADDQPETARAHADGVAALLGVAPPPSVPIESVSTDMADLHVGNRRVCNTRMKTELGVSLRFPTWREGARACLR
ncbi:MAG: NAD-dependent epimerase/dehydratase family protein [Deltaproteobacteria bacterium]|nr:NAD-dependent epimerase/dehydratase family protein [Deltaproteobacteria bacterium]